jgi:hypothetical protein
MFKIDILLHKCVICIVGFNTSRQVEIMKMLIISDTTQMVVAQHFQLFHGIMIIVITSLRISSGQFNQFNHCH